MPYEAEAAAGPLADAQRLMTRFPLARCRQGAQTAPPPPPRIAVWRERLTRLAHEESEDQKGPGTKGNEELIHSLDGFQGREAERKKPGAPGLEAASRSDAAQGCGGARREVGDSRGTRFLFQVTKMLRDGLR